VIAFVALFTFELGRRRHYLLFGVTLGLLALALPWFGSTDPDATRALAAGIFAFVYLLTDALLSGSALFSDDLVSGRSSFHFALPLPTWQLLVARVAAVLVALAAATALSILPAVAAGAEVLGDSGSLAVVLSAIAGPSESVVLPAETVIRASALALAVLGLVGLGNALAVMMKLRGGWLVLDLASGLVFSAALHRADDVLALPGFDGFRYLVLPGALLLAGLGFLAAASVQVISGRTDGQRAHRAFSLTWFAAAVALSIATSAFSKWYVSPTPDDLVRPGVSEHSRKYLEVHGTVWRPAPLEASFLVDRESGRIALLQVLGWRGMPHSWPSTAVVEGGRTAYWWKRERRSRNRILHRLDLAAADWRPEATPLEIEPGWVTGPISPDGTVAYRAKFSDQRTIELAADRTDGAGVLFSRQIETPGYQSVRWVGATEGALTFLLLVEEGSPWAELATEPLAMLPESCADAPGTTLDGEHARRLRAVLLEVGAGDGEPLPLPISLPVSTYGDDPGVAVGGPEDDRSMVLRLGRRGWARVDAASGRVTGCIRLPEGSEARWMYPHLLSGGRSLVQSRIGDECQWTLFDSTGREVLSVPYAGNGYESGLVVGDGTRVLHAFPVGLAPFRGSHVSTALPDPHCRPTRHLAPGWYLRALDPAAGRIEQEGPLSREVLLHRLFTGGPAGRNVGRAS
jgi:hypothetical protein